MLTLTRYTPRFSNTWRELDELLRDAWSDGPRAALAPAADVVEGPRAVQLRVDLPGVNPEAIEVKVEGDVLTISAERAEDTLEEGAGFVRQERHVGRFVRSFTLARTLDGSKPEATYRHGVLTVSLPKREEVLPRAVKVKVEA